MSQRLGRLESRWVTVARRRLHARVSVDPVPAEAPTVVLVHGLVVSSCYMVPTAIRLAPECRVYAPDLPGFGKSDKPAHVLSVPELADALGTWMEAAEIDQALLLGNSMGCQIAADLAVRYPKRVDRLVLQGPTTDPKARTALQQVVRLLRNAPYERPSLGPILVRDYLAAGAFRALRTFRYMLEDRIEEKLPRVRVPTLVVRGSRDPVVPQRWAEEATRLLPMGRLVVIPGWGHTLNYSAPLELVRVVRPFLYKRDEVRRQVA